MSLRDIPLIPEDIPWKYVPQILTGLNTSTQSQSTLSSITTPTTEETSSTHHWQTMTKTFATTATEDTTSTDDTTSTEDTTSTDDTTSHSCTLIYPHWGIVKVCLDDPSKIQLCDIEDPYKPPRIKECRRRCEEVNDIWEDLSFDAYGDPDNYNDVTIDSILPEGMWSADILSINMTLGCSHFPTNPILNGGEAFQSFYNTAYPNYLGTGIDPHFRVLGDCSWHYAIGEQTINFTTPLWRCGPAPSTQWQTLNTMRATYQNLDYEPELWPTFYSTINSCSLASQLHCPLELPITVTTPPAMGCGNGNPCIGSYPYGCGSYAVVIGETPVECRNGTINVEFDVTCTGGGYFCPYNEPGGGWELAEAWASSYCQTFVELWGLFMPDGTWIRLSGGTSNTGIFDDPTIFGWGTGQYGFYCGQDWTNAYEPPWSTCGTGTSHYHRVNQYDVTNYHIDSRYVMGKRNRIVWVANIFASGQDSGSHPCYQKGQPSASININQLNVEWLG